MVVYVYPPPNHPCNTPYRLDARNVANSWSTGESMAWGGGRRGWNRRTRSINYDRKRSGAASSRWFYVPSARAFYAVTRTKRSLLSPWMEPCYFAPRKGSLSHRSVKVSAFLPFFFFFNPVSFTTHNRLHFLFYRRCSRRCTYSILFYDDRSCDGTILYYM